MRYGGLSFSQKRDEKALKKGFRLQTPAPDRGSWDNQKIVNVYNANNGQVNDGWAISMALSLYLDFLNLFLFLLRIFGIAGGNRD